MKAIEQYKIITFTHRRTDLNGIGQFVLRPKTEEQAVLEQLHAFKQQIGAKEIYYLSTCNRILFLVLAQKEDKGKAFKQKFMQTLYADLSETLQAKALKEAFLYEGLEAIDHFFRVSASMDSLVVGEREILRQLREAYQDNLEQGLTGDAIRLLMRFTVETAKKVYSSTRIGEKPVSVVSLAVSKLMQAQLPPSSRFLLLGAGQTNALFAKFLKKYGYHKVTVFNRSLKKAQELAQDFDGEGLLLNQLGEYRKGFDVVVAATGAKSALLTSSLYGQLLGQEAATSSKLLIDLSIPNNIEPTIAEQYPKAQYIPIESLRELAQKNLAFREQELERAKEVVEEQLDIFYQAFKERLIELALREVPIQVKAIRQHALNNVFKKELADLDEESLALLDRMMAYMEKRCIAIPLQVAKQNMLKED